MPLPQCAMLQCLYMFIHVVMCYDVRDVNNEAGLCAVNIRVLHGSLVALLSYQVVYQL